MSGQAPAQPTTTATTSITYYAAPLGVAAGGSEAPESDQFGHEASGRQADEPRERRVSRSQGDADSASRNFRAPGVDSILNPPERYSQRRVSSSGPAIAEATSHRDSTAPDLGHRTSLHRSSRVFDESVLPVTNYRRRRDTASSGVESDGLDRFEWRNAPRRGTVTADADSDPVRPRITLSTSQDARNPPRSLLERPPLTRSAGSKSSQDALYSPYERQSMAASGAANSSVNAPSWEQTVAGQEPQTAEEDPSRRRSGGTDFITSDADQHQRPNSASRVLSGPQYMTLQTDQGPISFPVDVQAASKGADEKRRRNASASARFRARRKEREQASSQEIDELRHNIRNLNEEVEFYRRERDYLASALYQGPDRERHFPRPTSPRRRRYSAQSADADMPQMRRVSPPRQPHLYQQRGERGSFERNTRRRIVGEFSSGSTQPALSPLTQPIYASERFPAVQRERPQSPLQPPPQPQPRPRPQGTPEQLLSAHMPPLQGAPAQQPSAGQLPQIQDPYFPPRGRRRNLDRPSPRPPP